MSKTSEISQHPLLEESAGAGFVYEECADGAPGVVGVTVGLDGYGCLAFVEEEFHEDVLRILLVTQEDNLDISGHGGYLPVGEMLVEVGGIGGHEVAVLEMECGGERDQVAVVAEAEIGRRLSRGEGHVGALHDVHNQGMCVVCHHSAVAPEGAVVHVEDIVEALPEVEKFLRSENVIE